MNRLPEPIASLSLDLDDRWTYLKTHGDAGWRGFPTYLPVLVPRALRFFEDHSLRVTFFIVGQDAARRENRQLLQSIAAAGHEIGNHSFRHEPWLHLYSPDELRREITTAEEWIGEATGRRTIGFRGPGFSISPAVLDVLSNRGYFYDASTLPTFLGPLARLYYLVTSRLPPAERRRRARLFGRLRDGLLPLKPHWKQTANGRILEMPVTTMPVLRAPFHLSYLGWLLTYSEGAAHLWLNTALSLCQTFGICPSFLLHPLDFLDLKDAPDLGFFPAMKMPWQQKLELAEFAVDAIGSRWRIVPVGEHAAGFSAGVTAGASAMAGRSNL